MDVPDDLLKMAGAVTDAAEAECRAQRYFYGFGTGNAKTVLDRHIAQALMAERKRCAKIAEDYADDFRGENSGDEPRMIVAAIRAQVVSVRRPNITVRNRTESEQSAGETGNKHE